MANKPSAPAPMDLNMVNANQRAAVLAYALDQELQVYATRFTPPNTGAPGQVINVPLRNVGLVKKLTVLVRARMRCVNAGDTATLQPFGPANFFSNILLTDLGNQTRINCTGWYLHYVATARDAAAFGAAFSNDSPTSIGNNFDVIKAPATLSGVTPQTISMAYEIPLAYSDTDLRGCLYANVLNATWNLSLTVNANMFVASTGNGVGAVYKMGAGNPLGVIDSWDIEVYQHFLDQLPVDNRGQVILPLLDTSVMYRLENTVQTGLVAGQELSTPYANFRKFLSTIVVFDNAGTLNPGADIDYISMQTANTTALFKRTPQMMALQTRKRIGDDFPAGMYYIDHRKRPIETSAFGNVQLSYSLKNVVSAQSQLLLGFEYFAETNTLTQAGSIQN